MEDDTLIAMERLENAYGEIKAAERLIDQSRQAEELKSVDLSFFDWLPLIARGKLMDARKAAAYAIEALDDARAALHELHRMKHGDEEESEQGLDKLNNW